VAVAVAVAVAKAVAIARAVARAWQGGWQWLWHWRIPLPCGGLLGRMRWWWRRRCGSEVCGSIGGKFGGGSGGRGQRV
jgi:hypothetical protein